MMAESSGAPKSRPPKPPSDLVPRGRGRRFWGAVWAEFEPDLREVELLAETCRLLDLVDRLRAEADAGPLLINGRLSPLFVELRQCRMQLRRHLNSLCLPADESVDADTGEPSPDVASFRSWQARRAARARWS